MSPNTIQFIGSLALGATVFFMLVCGRELHLLIKNRRELREYAAREPEREQTADRFIARSRAQSNIAKPAPKPKTAAVAVAKPKTEAVRKPVAAAKPKTAPVATAPKTSARAKTAEKWTPFSDFL